MSSDQSAATSIAANKIRKAVPAEYDVKWDRTSVTVYSSVDKAAEIAKRIQRLGYQPTDRCAASRRVQWVKVSIRIPGTA